MPRPSIAPADDLGMFFHIAQHLKDGKSLREIADKLRVPTSAVHDVIARLERNFGGVTLVNRLAGSQHSALAAAGELLCSRIEHCVDDSLDNQTPIRVRVSYSLLQSTVLFPLVTEWLPSHGGQITDNLVDVQTALELNYDREVEKLLNGSLDLLVAWGLPNRRKVRTPGIEISEIGPPFPIAFISHSRRILRDCTFAANSSKAGEGIGPNGTKSVPPWEPMKINIARIIDSCCTYRIATLDASKQPLGERLVDEGLYTIGNRRIVASSFHSIIDLVRSKIADIGIIPLAGRDLYSLHLTGQVCYQTLDEPIDPDPLARDDHGLHIIAVRRKQSLEKDAFRSSLINTTIDSIRECFATQDVSGDEGHLETAISSAVFSNNFVLAPLPMEDVTFFENLKYGYYLWPMARIDGDSDRDSSHLVDWCDEEIEFRFKTKRKAKGPLEIDPKRSVIKNKRNQLFRIEFGRVSDGAFVFVASLEKGSPDYRTNCGFIGTLNAGVSLAQCSTTQVLSPIVVGSWNGGAGQSQLATWGLIFSAKKLSKKSLNMIATRASLTYILHSVLG